MNDEQPQDAGAPGTEGAEAPQEEHDSEIAREVRDAMRAVGEELNRLFSALGSAIRDPAVQEKAKATGTSIIDSVGDAFNTIADQVRDTFNRRPSSDDEPGSTEDEAAHRELDDADAVDEIRADLEDDGEE